LRRRGGPSRHAQIWNGRSARLFRRRRALAVPLRLFRIRPADTVRRGGGTRMKFSLAWLREYLETDAGAADIAARLNAIGLEVEGVEDPAEKLAGFRIARVLTAAPHPDADKLQVLSVDTGEGDPLQVVCGA